MKVTTYCKNQVYQCPTLSTLNKTVIDESSLNDDQVGHEQPDPDKDSIASFRTINSNLTLVGHNKMYMMHNKKNPKITRNRTVQSKDMT